MGEPEFLTDHNTDEQYMQLAVQQARKAWQDGDVPVGCIIVHQEKVIARACNQRQLLNDATAHAEIIAITQACEYLDSWRLNGCSVYVTLEPCPMCAGALVLARVDRLVYGCDDPKTGAVRSLYNIVRDPRLNHCIEVTSGVCEQLCSSMLSDFFAVRRRENKAQSSDESGSGARDDL